MSGTLILISGLALLGGALACWLLARALPPVFPRSAAVPSRPVEYPLPGSDDEGRGLAAFYAYQMAVGRIGRGSVG